MKEKVLPTFILLSAQILPPWWSTISLDMDSPSPVPPSRLVKESSTCWNFSKIFSRFSSEMIKDKRFTSYVQVSVSDEGIGISEENLEKIFEKFQQVQDSFTRREGGTGLGLSISKEIVSHHGGRIWAESEVNVGSTFSFTIPYDENMKVPDMEEEEGGPVAESEKEHAGKAG